MSEPLWSSDIGDPAWDDALSRVPDGHFLQSAGWARVRAGQGWEVQRLAVGVDGRFRPLAQVLVRRTALGAIGYVPRGPACGPDSPLWPFALDALRARFRNRCVAMRYEPSWPDLASTRTRLRRAGLRPTEPVQPPSTIRVDLTADEDALLAGMKQKWRYNVRLADRRGVEVSLGGEVDLAAFESMMDVTALRDGFSRRSAGYYAGVWRAFGAHRADLFLARHGDDVLAAILVVRFGNTATYLYGASTDAERQRMPNHALQWAAMRHARARGCRWYDLWGIPDEIGIAVGLGADADTVPPGSGGLWGVWGFKRGFGGAVCRSIGAWDDVFAPFRYRLVSTGARMVLRALGRRRP